MPTLRFIPVQGMRGGLHTDSEEATCSAVQLSADVEPIEMGPGQAQGTPMARRIGTQREGDRGSELTNRGLQARL
jgi:hypothetical protein